MAGTFTSQTKIRPGAYVVFKSVASATLNPGTRGIVAIPMQLTWGDTNDLIEVTANDYLSGRIYEKLGIKVGDPASIALREIFKNASSALVGRLNTTGEKATTTVDLAGTSVTFEAKHPGTLGNQISIACEENTVTRALELVISVGGSVVERQTVTTIATFAANPWVVVSSTTPATTNFTTFSAAVLNGGTNGSTVTDLQYNTFLEKCSNQVWNVLAVPSDASAVISSVVAYVKRWREDEGKKVQAVVYNYPAANYEGIISVDQGYMIGAEEVSAMDFTAYVAGMTAGATIIQSNTYKVIEGATGIINPASSVQIESGLRQGKLMLSMRQDRSIVVEKDINTLHAYTPEKSYVFSKNRVIRCLDDIATQVTLLFENGFIGKVNNDESGRTLFKGAIIGYLNELQNQGAIQNFDSATDLNVDSGNDLESVVCGIAVQPVDSMEKLYLTVVVS